jgi:hypothetical protein
MSIPTITNLRLVILKISFIILILSMQACVKDVVVNVPKITVVYENDFETYDQKGFKVYSFENGNFGLFDRVNILDFNKTKVLGRFNNGKAILQLDSLPMHNAINIQFDLFIHDIWSNDLWKMEFDKREVLVTGFSNIENVMQAYPNWIGNGSALNPPGSNAFDLNLTGACRNISKTNGTSYYKMERTVMHSDSTFIFAGSDAGAYFQLNCDRSWSIDNMKISVIYNPKK